MCLCSQPKKIGKIQNNRLRSRCQCQIIRCGAREARRCVGYSDFRPRSGAAQGPRDALRPSAILSRTQRNVATVVGATEVGVGDARTRYSLAKALIRCCQLATCFKTADSFLCTQIDALGALPGSSNRGIRHKRVRWMHRNL